MAQQYNDCKHEALSNQGYSGQVNDMEYQYLQDNGAVAPGNLNDLWYQVFSNAGIPVGQFNDMAYAWLETLGYTQGSLTERWFAFWCDGGIISILPNELLNSRMCAGSSEDATVTPPTDWTVLGGALNILYRRTVNDSQWYLAPQAPGTSGFSQTITNLTGGKLYVASFRTVYVRPPVNDYKVGAISGTGVTIVKDFPLASETTNGGWASCTFTLDADANVTFEMTCQDAVGGNEVMIIGRPQVVESTENVQTDEIELIINGSFDADTDWTKQTGWSIGGGIASCDGSQTGDTLLFQNLLAWAIPNQAYRVKFTVLNYSVGNVFHRMGADRGPNQNADGTYVLVDLYFSGSNFAITGDVNFIGSVDDVSVQLVTEGGFALGQWTGNECNTPEILLVTDGNNDPVPYNGGYAYTGIGIINTIVDMPLTSDLIDLQGNLTDGKLLRASAASYIDPNDGLLKYAKGTREQIVDENAQENIIDSWWGFQARMANSTPEALIADTEFNTHYFQSTPVGLAGNTYLLSAKIKPGEDPVYGKDWCLLLSGGIAGNLTYFNVADGFVGSSEHEFADISGPDQDGYYRVWIVTTYPSNGNFGFGAAEANNTATFAGDDINVSIYIKEIMFEQLPGNPELGAENIDNGGFDTDTDWIKGTGWTISGGTANCDGSQTGNTDIYQTNVYPSTGVYQVEFTILNYIAGEVRIAGEGSTNGRESANGTYRYIFIRDINADPTIYIQGNVDFIGSVDNVSVKELPTFIVLEPSDYVNFQGTLPAEPRFEQQGLLVEGEGVNLAPWSENSDEWIEGANVIFTKNQSDPTGGNNATRYTLSAPSARTVAPGYASGDPANRTFTVSVWLKGLKGSNTVIVWQPVRDGIAVTTSSDVTVIDGEWRRYDYTYTFDGTAGDDFGFRLYDSSGDIGDLLDIFGFDFKEAPFLTSYTPTNGAPVVRATEEVDPGNTGYSWAQNIIIKNIFGNDPGNTVGTIILEWTPQHDFDDIEAVTVYGILTPSTAANVLLYYYDGGAGDRRFTLRDGTNIAKFVKEYTTGNTYIIAPRWDENANGGAGYQVISVKESGAWSHGLKTNFDGDYEEQFNTFLHFSNEFPAHLKHIYFYDMWITSYDLDNGNYPNAEALLVEIQPAANYMMNEGWNAEALANNTLLSVEGTGGNWFSMSRAQLTACDFPPMMPAPIKNDLKQALAMQGVICP